jgi:hypothetical protein
MMHLVTINETTHRVVFEDQTLVELKGKTVDEVKSLLPDCIYTPQGQETSWRWNLETDQFDQV